MCVTKKIAKQRDAFTLVEMLVVIAVILAISALAAAFAPRVNDNQNLSRAVDNLEQWLLTAKMRAKRDGLATGVRFIQVQGDLAGTYSQLQYIQQPDSLSGYPNTKTLTALNGLVTFSGEDFTMGGAVLAQGLVQPGDYLEVHGSGVYMIHLVATPNTLKLLTAGVVGTYDNSLTLATATSNYRILRQPRILIGEEPLTLPNNFAVDMRIIPGPAIFQPIIPANSIIPGNTTILWSNVAPGPSGYPEILFSPTGAVVGTNAGSGKVLLSVYDQTMTPFDINRVGIVAVQCRTGFIGAYSVAPGADLFYFAEVARESGL